MKKDTKYNKIKSFLKTTMLSDWKITTAHVTQRDQDEMQKWKKIPEGIFDRENAVSRTFVTFSARHEKEKLTKSNCTR